VKRKEERKKERKEEISKQNVEEKKEKEEYNCKVDPVESVACSQYLQ